jgi:hypothetical protein
MDGLEPKLCQNLGAEYEPFSECFIHRKLAHVQFKLK